MPKTHFAEQKYKDVYIYYSLWIKRHKREARNYTRWRIYFEISRPFYLLPHTTLKMISKATREKYVPTKYEIEDFKNRFDGIIDIKDLLSNRIR